MQTNLRLRSCHKNRKNSSSVKEKRNTPPDGRRHNYKSIAERSFISYETVRTHVKHIYKKLHVASRSEAVMKALQQGLS